MANNLRAGVPEFARLVAAQQPREPEWHIQLGDAQLANGEPVKAVAAYQSALRLRPDMTRALQAIAKALRTAGQLPASVETLRKAIDIAPDDGASWYQLAVAESDLGRNEDAIEKLRRAIALDPDLPGVHTTLASIQFSAGQVAAAEAAMSEALKIDPYDSVAWDLAGRVLTTKGSYPEAFFSFERSIRYRPDFAPHLYDYALALSAATDFDRAEEVVRKALRADAAMAEPHALLGGLLARKRQLAEAASEYREAVRLRPAMARTRLDLASTLAAAGNLREAVEQLREVARSEDAEAARIAVNALQRMGQQ
jgi:tetratricopeptide (TPR) repeat protein